MTDTSSQQPAASNQLSVTFTDMAYGGDAVGREQESGLAVFAWPGMTGETASVQVTARRPSFLRGVVTQVHEVSPDRVDAPCPYFGRCGGCQWQHMAYGAQLASKHGILRGQLARLGGVAEADLEGALGEAIAAPQPFGYRNSSQFALDPEARLLAYHARGGALLTVDHCPISNSGVNEAVPIVNSMLAGGLTDGEVGADRHGLMRVTRVAIRSSERTGQTVVVFHTGPDTQGSGGRSRRAYMGKDIPPRPEEPNSEVTTGRNPALYISRREMRRAVRALSASRGPWVEDQGFGVRDQIEFLPSDSQSPIPNPRPPTPDPRPALALTAIEVMHDGTTNLLGETRGAHALTSETLAEAYTGALLGRRGEEASGQGRPSPPLGAWTERLGGRIYWVAPQAFFQVNTEAAELLLAEALSHVPARLGLAVDAHAGVGTFALQLAGRSERVFGFETERASVVSAQWTARAHSMENVTFSVGRAEQLMARLPNDMRPDLVLLDPPRAGCHPQLLVEIARRAVPLIICVSCDPSTLARDVKLLSANYRLTSARVVDLFPQTYHIETVAVLVKREG